MELQQQSALNPKGIDDHRQCNGGSGSEEGHSQHAHAIRPEIETADDRQLG